MNQPFFPFIISILASMFFGVISNWIYEILRKHGALPDKPNMKKVVIISLVGLAFILLINLDPVAFNSLSNWMLHYSYMPNWLIIVILTTIAITGFWAGQRKTRKLSNTLRNKNKIISDLKKSMEQQDKSVQDDLEEDIINPK